VDIPLDELELGELVPPAGDPANVGYAADWTGGAYPRRIVDVIIPIPGLRADGLLPSNLAVFSK
jgi:hypothetical protein